MEAIHLPPQILHQQTQGSTVLPGTPPPIGMTPRSHDEESTWQEVAYEYTRGEIFASHDRFQRIESFYVPQSHALMMTCRPLAQESCHDAQEIPNNGITDPL